MRVLITFIILLVFVAPSPAFSAKDQDDLNGRELVDKDFKRAAKEADNNLKKIEDTIDDIEKEMKAMKKDIAESIMRLKLVVKLAQKKHLNIKKINKIWDEVLKDQGRLEDAIKEIDDQHKDMDKFFDKYNKAIIQIGK